MCGLLENLLRSKKNILEVLCIEEVTIESEDLLQEELRLATTYSYYLELIEIYIKNERKTVTQREGERKKHNSQEV